MFYSLTSSQSLIPWPTWSPTSASPSAQTRRPLTLSVPTTRSCSSIFPTFLCIWMQDTLVGWDGLPILARLQLCSAKSTQMLASRPPFVVLPPTLPTTMLSALPPALHIPRAMPTAMRRDTSMLCHLSSPLPDSLLISLLTPLEMVCSPHNNKLGEIGAMLLALDLVSDPPRTLEMLWQMLSSGSNLVENATFVGSYLIMDPLLTSLI